jgi:hypothetical protein
VVLSDTSRETPAECAWPEGTSQTNHTHTDTHTHTISLPSESYLLYLCLVDHGALQVQDLVGLAHVHLAADHGRGGGGGAAVLRVYTPHHITSHVMSCRRGGAVE